MENRTGIVMFVLGLIGTLGGGWWVYDVKYHRMFWNSQQEFQAMIPGIIIGIIALIVLIIGIAKFTSGEGAKKSGQ